MLICAIYAIGIYAQGILSNTISTGTKNCVFVLRQLKLADAPWRANSNPNKPNFKGKNAAAFGDWCFYLKL